VGRIVIGVDPHKSSATIEVLDERQRVLGGGRFGTDRDGYQRMLAAARRWRQRVGAVEGCNGIGRPLAQRLVANGETVLDVPAKLSARARVFSTGQGSKTDATDAHSIAVVAVRTPGLRAVVVDGELVVLRLLADRREELAGVRIQIVSRPHTGPRRPAAPRHWPLTGRPAPPGAARPPSGSAIRREPHPRSATPSSGTGHRPESSRLLGNTGRRAGRKLVRHASARFVPWRQSTGTRGRTKPGFRGCAGASYPQVGARLRRWWRVMDSNHRRLCRRFYRTPALRPHGAVASGFTPAGQLCDRLVRHTSVPSP
jgi:hypothetical protein